MLPVHWLLRKHCKGNMINATLQERGATKIDANFEANKILYWWYNRLEGKGSALPVTVLFACFFKDS